MNSTTQTQTPAENNYRPTPTDDPVADEVAAKAVENRLRRALTETLDVETDAFHAPGLVLVWSASGSQYVVDVDEGTCSCPDHQEGGHYCKHILRAVFETATDPLDGGNFGCGACHRETFCMAHD